MNVVLQGRIVVAGYFYAFQDEDNAEKQHCGQGPGHKHQAVVRSGPVTGVTPTFGCSRCMGEQLSPRLYFSLCV